MDGTVMRDVRLERAKEREEAARADGPRARCLECDRPLPKGLHRSHCLDHSAYAQALMRRERRRDGSRLVA